MSKNKVYNAVKKFVLESFLSTFRTSGRKGNTDDMETYKEVTKYREDSDFIRIVPCAVLLLLVEIGGMLSIAVFGEHSNYLLVYHATCLSSFVVCLFFCFFVNHVLNLEGDTTAMKRAGALGYWIFHTASSLTFSVCELIDAGTMNNFYILVTIFTFIPLVKPKFKSIYYAITGITESAVILYTHAGYQKFWTMVMVLLLAFVVSSSIYSSYMTDHILRSRLEKLSKIDPLTGLLNRRGLYKSIDFLLPYYNRQNIKILVVMCDIDFFKNYNDTFGHTAGDECLVAVSNCIKNSFSRKADITARFGGEEFVIIVGGKPDDNLLEHLLHLEQNIRELGFEAGKKDACDNVTISLGAYEADTGNGELSIDGLIKKADEQLYMAKQSGRNCVVYNNKVYREENGNGK